MSEESRSDAGATRPQSAGFQAVWPALFCLLLAAFTPPVGAVILFSTGDPAANTTAPTGDLADSGWQWMGSWGNFTGMPIAPHYFITAGHVGGQVGQVLTLNGMPHHATKVFRPTGGDLALWQVREPFVTWAPTTNHFDETGLSAVIFGRGTQRGGAVVSTGIPMRTNGWYWGPSDGRLRWGQNRIDQLVSYNDDGTNDLLVMDFNSKGLPSECTYSSGDSGGGVFAQTALGWTLVGVNALVEGPFNTSTNGDGFQAAIFDARGLYIKNNTTWDLLPAFGPENPASLYGLRLSVFADWVASVTEAPLDLPPELLRAPTAGGPYEVDGTALPDTSLNQFTVPAPTSTTFFRLRDDLRTLSITFGAVSSASITLRYSAQTAP